MRGLGILISIGRWGGVYVALHGFAPRVCLGFVAITLLPCDGDDMLQLAAIAAGHMSGNDDA